MRMIEPMEFKLRDANKDSNLEVIRRIFWALVCWVSQFTQLIQYCAFLNLAVYRRRYLLAKSLGCLSIRHRKRRS